MGVVIVDLFAGMGGWSEGLRMLGLYGVGLEIEPTSCRTRVAAGYHTIRGDVSEVDPRMFRNVCGLIASPPCTDFSVAGLRRGFEGETGHLVFEIMRWARVLNPEWIACEQVPPVLPIWREYASKLRAMGYSAWAGILNSANWGVPQTRERAILMASRIRDVSPPLPTHRKGGGLTLFGDALLPWVSMAEALGWMDAQEVCPNFLGMTTGSPTFSPNDRPSRTVLEKARDWQVRTGRDTMKHSRRNEDMVPYERGIDEPAPTLDGKAGHAWKVVPSALKSNNQAHAADSSVSLPAPTLFFGHASNDVRWVFDRPATTVVGSFRPDVIAGPGHHDGSRQDANGSVKISVPEALILQGFRPDYPVQGSWTAQFSQIGNAFPPPVAAAVVGELAGIDWQAVIGHDRERMAS